MTSYRELNLLIQAAEQSLARIPKNTTELSEQIKQKLIGKTIKDTQDLDFIVKAAQCADDHGYLVTKLHKFDTRRETLLTILSDLTRERDCLLDKIRRDFQLNEIFNLD